MEIDNILVKPIITEKSMADAALGVYTFMVTKKAGKGAIKKAIEKQFKVKVISIRTISVKGKTKSTGRLRKKIKTSDWKKAKVALKKDQK